MARAAEVWKDMRSSNPVLSRPDVFSRGGYAPAYGQPGATSRPMTLNDELEVVWSRWDKAQGKVIGQQARRAEP